MSIPVMAEVGPAHIPEVPAPSLPPRAVDSVEPESCQIQTPTQTLNAETLPLPVTVQADHNVSSQHEAEDTATGNGACVGEDDEVQFIFSAPRRKKKKRRRYGFTHLDIALLITCQGRAF